MKYHHCDRIGCYIVVQQGNPVVEALNNQNAMKVRVTQFRGKSIDLNVPLKGFGEAHAAMVEFAKQKASSAAPAQRLALIAYSVVLRSNRAASSPPRPCFAPRQFRHNSAPAVCY